ncbi:MAG: D-alanine--D-alanine ligase [Helicobacteraceae bacterium]
MKFAIIFGGQSYEHEISIVSAIALKRALKADMSFIFCDAAREFYLIEPRFMRSNYFSSGAYKKASRLDLGAGGFFARGLWGKRRVSFDVAVNLIHGADGEDGKMASLLEFYGVKYIGARVEASAISFSKLWTKHLAAQVGVKTLDYELLSSKDQTPSRLAFPFILKPTHLGSSIGVSVVRSAADLAYAKDTAFEFDDSVLAEPFIEGVKEYNLAGCFAGGEFLFSNIEEPAKKAFLDFEQKYLNFSQERAVQALLSADLAARLKAAFKKLYTPYFHGALIRCDFFELGGEVYLNEINPHPGSLANYLFDDFTGVLTRLASDLPRAQNIPIFYNYISSIQSAKGKL